MNKLINFLRKPRNIYLSIVVMFIVVAGLTTITFSYYVEDSTDATQIMKVSKVNTFIQSDDITDEGVKLLPNETKDININIINNDKVETIYKLYYLDSNINVVVNKPIVNAIKSKNVYNYTLTITNNSNEEVTFKLGIVTGYMGNSIKVPENSIEIK